MVDSGRYWRTGKLYRELDEPKGYIIRGYDYIYLFSLEECRQHILDNPRCYVDWEEVEKFYQEHPKGVIYFS